MRWLVPKIGDGPSAVAMRLRTEGHVVDEVVVGRIVPLSVTLPPCDWVIVTSRHAVPALRGLSPSMRLAAIGRATAAALTGAGFMVAFVPSQADGATLRTELAPRLKATDRVVRVKPKGAPDGLAALAARCVYRTLDVYENVSVPLAPIDLAQYDAAYFTCPSAVERVFAVATGMTRCEAIGPTTRAALDRRLTCPKCAEF